MTADVTLKIIVDALPLPTLIVGADDRVVASNDGATSILGDTMVGRHYIAALRQPGLLEAVEEVRAGKARATALFAGREASKETVYQVHVAPAGQDIFLSFEDQTATEEAGQMRREFVANVSHELRTPLTALLGFIETLMGPARDDPGARDRFLNIMAKEANRMTRLVDDLLSLSRVEEEERVRPREMVDLGELLASVIHGLEPQVKAAGVHVQLQNHGDGQKVPGDHGQLAQVFTNLIENGLKYGGDGEKITVSLDPQTHHARLRGIGIKITVTDEGQGIAPHHIARLTERFYRVDSHRSREIGGTGLGLAIVKHIVSRHRGRLEIKSELGIGTQVAVILPTEAVS